MGETVKYSDIEDYTREFEEVLELFDDDEIKETLQEIYDDGIVMWRQDRENPYQICFECHVGLRKKTKGVDCSIKLLKAIGSGDQETRHGIRAVLQERWNHAHRDYIDTQTDYTPICQEETALFWIDSETGERLDTETKKKRWEQIKEDPELLKTGEYD